VGKARIIDVVGVAIEEFPIAQAVANAALAVGDVGGDV
jgi:hypothetical protein